MKNDWSEVKKDLLKDKELERAYKKLDIKHVIGKLITDFRIWLKKIN
jgi:hypothetical protein